MIFANNDTNLIGIETLENMTTSDSTLPVTVVEMDLPVVDRTASLADKIDDPNNLIKPKAEHSEYVVMFVEKRQGSTLITVAKFARHAGHFSEDQYSQSIMKFFNARKKRIAK